MIQLAASPWLASRCQSRTGCERAESLHV